ncbi:MAG: hypothetical protein OZSIB_0483 [Candidatus Ozemobacter sibiricus]|jgi:tetratricopeptide (TPR) repeat protein|uniref:Tetratricopeptide repeat protein n=1 Tax=Candidatus Ozemobacter sibiricus TaxID=2268124 RepID=A0A367ZNH8_9BACT|nr:MAG: hypothetical protein OZSIB_0483 [Candidatus Ozemobacter sibiricus]
MLAPREFAATQFRPHPLVWLIGPVVTTLSLQMLTGNTYLMILPSSAGLVIGLVLAFFLLALLGRRLSDALLARFDLMLPTVGLWFHPFMLIGLTGLLGMFLLVVWPAWAGRGFWPTFLHLNAKVTTIAFSTTFFSFALFLGGFVLLEVGRYLGWSVDLAEEMWKTVQGEAAAAATGLAQGETAGLQIGLAAMKERLRQLEQARLRAQRCNRVAALGVFALLLLAGTAVVFFRPELILFYRGEAQLRSFREPEVAFETFEHLARKYPRYKYLDTVTYYATWTLERRLNRYAEAARRYEAWLQRFGPDNIWADEVMANLTRLHLDKLASPAVALEWARRYQQHFPEGIMAPHVALYEVRALQELGRLDEARAVLRQARERFAGRLIVLYDSEDDFLARLPFEAAALPLEM